MSDLGTGNAVLPPVVSCAQYADDDVVQWYAIAQNPVDDAGSGAPAYLKRAGFRCTVLGDEFSGAPRRGARRGAPSPYPRGACAWRRQRPVDAMGRSRNGPQRAGRGAAHGEGGGVPRRPTGVRDVVARVGGRAGQVVPMSPAGSDRPRAGRPAPGRARWSAPTRRRSRGRTWTSRWPRTSRAAARTKVGTLCSSTPASRGHASLVRSPPAIRAVAD